MKPFCANNPEIVTPKSTLVAYKIGKLSGFVVVLFAVAFLFFFKNRLNDSVFYALLCSGSFLICALPAWFVGRLAKREYVESSGILKGCGT